MTGYAIEVYITPWHKRIRYFIEDLIALVHGQGDDLETHR